MAFKDIPIKSTLNEEETESTTISNLMKQWPYMDVTKTETETEIPISQPKCKFYFSFAFWWEKERERTRDFLFAKHDFFLSKIIQGIPMYHLLMIDS